MHWPLSPEIEEVKSCADTRQRHTWEPGQRRTRRCVKGVAWNQRRCWECLATLRTLTKSGSPREDVTTPHPHAKEGQGRALRAGGGQSGQKGPQGVKGRDEGGLGDIWESDGYTLVPTPSAKRKAVNKEKSTLYNLCALSSA